MKEAPYAEYLERIDILYVQVRNTEIARTRSLGHWRNVDLDADGNVVAVEFINAMSLGVDLTDIPERDTVERLIREADVPLELTLPT
jgi:uncharacterized protein YuzE